MGELEDYNAKVKKLLSNIRSLNPRMLIKRPRQVFLSTYFIIQVFSFFENEMDK